MHAFSFRLEQVFSLSCAILIVTKNVVGDSIGKSPADSNFLPEFRDRYPCCFRVYLFGFAYLWIRANYIIPRERTADAPL